MFVKRQHKSQPAIKRDGKYGIAYFGLIFICRFDSKEVHLYKFRAGNLGFIILFKEKQGIRSFQVVQC